MIYELLELLELLDKHEYPHHYVRDCYDHRYLKIIRSIRVIRQALNISHISPWHLVWLMQLPLPIAGPALDDTS